MSKQDREIENQIREAISSAWPYTVVTRPLIEPLKALIKQREAEARIELLKKLKAEHDKWSVKEYSKFGSASGGFVHNAVSKWLDNHLKEQNND